MYPGLGVVARHGYGGVHSVGAFITSGEASKKVCVLKVLFIQLSLEVEVPETLLLHVTRCSIFSNSSIILPGLRASIGVTRSYSSCPFLCTHEES